LGFGFLYTCRVGCLWQFCAASHGDPHALSFVTAVCSLFACYTCVQDCFFLRPETHPRPPQLCGARASCAAPTAAHPAPCSRSDRQRLQGAGSATCLGRTVVPSVHNACTPRGMYRCHTQQETGQPSLLVCLDLILVLWRRQDRILSDSPAWLYVCVCMCMVVRVCVSLCLCVIHISMPLPDAAAPQSSSPENGALVSRHCGVTICLWRVLQDLSGPTPQGVSVCGACRRACPERPTQIYTSQPPLLRGSRQATKPQTVRQASRTPCEASRAGGAVVRLCGSDSRRLQCLPHRALGPLPSVS
jgi:hypothetical protein